MALSIVRVCIVELSEAGQLGLWPWPVTVEPNDACLHGLVFARHQDPFGECLVPVETPEQSHLSKPVDPLWTSVFLRVLLESSVAGSFDLAHLGLVMSDEGPLGPLYGLLQRFVYGVPHACAVHPFVLDFDGPREAFADDPDALGGL